MGWILAPLPRLPHHYTDEDEQAVTTVTSIEVNLLRHASWRLISSESWGFSVSACYPRLAPWAAFLRRSAAQPSMNNREAATENSRQATPENSREAATEHSPRRKPWVRNPQTDKPQRGERKVATIPRSHQLVVIDAGKSSRLRIPVDPLNLHWNRAPVLQLVRVPTSSCPNTCTC